MFRIVALLFICFIITNCTMTNPGLHAARLQGVTTSSLKNYNDNPAPVKSIISESIALSQKRLSYIYGSADPKNGGMDCSGTIHYLLSAKLYAVPREADQQYLWIKKYGKLHVVNSHRFTSPQFKYLKPGDLLFWSGTYKAKRAHNITHVMLYLGKSKNGKSLMFGSNTKGSYKDSASHGVGIYEFDVSSRRAKGRFVGYGCIPNETCKFA